MDYGTEVLALCLAADPRATLGWHRVYLVLTAISAVLIGLVWAGVEPFSAIPPVGVAGIVVALFAAASAVHLYDVRRWRDGTDEPPDFSATLGEDVIEQDAIDDREETQDVERGDGGEEEPDGEVNNRNTGGHDREGERERE